MLAGPAEKSLLLSSALVNHMCQKGMLVFQTRFLGEQNDYDGPPSRVGVSNSTHVGPMGLASTCPKFLVIISNID